MGEWASTTESTWANAFDSGGFWGLGRFEVCVQRLV
jgi:hypothetical protein